MSPDPEEDGQLHTLCLLERFRSEFADLWSSSSEAYFRVERMMRELNNPNLHDINRTSVTTSNFGTSATYMFGGLSRRQTPSPLHTPRSKPLSPTGRATISN
jgi:hypothetical protein